MKPLTLYQQAFAVHRLTFNEVLSPEVRECLTRTMIACGENGKQKAGIIDLVCGLYLGYPEQVGQYFRPDFASILSQNFPVHRLGSDGLLPASAIKRREAGEDRGFWVPMNYSDEVLRALWLATALANLAGKKQPPVQDVITAVLQEQEWKDELQRYGLEPVHKVAE